MEEVNPNPPAKPNDHLVMAIVSTVLSVITCTIWGVIPGVISIVFASQVDTKYKIADYEGAEKSSKYAKIAWIVSIIISVATLIISFLFFGFALSEIIDGFKEGVSN